MSDSGSATKPVAIALLASSAAYIVLLLFAAVFFSLDLDPTSDRYAVHVYMVFCCSIPIVFNSLLIWGATCMYRRSSYMWAFATCCLAIFPLCGPMYVIGIPLGVWGFFVLRRPEVRDSFQYM